VSRAGTGAGGSGETKLEESRSTPRGGPPIPPPGLFSLLATVAATPHRVVKLFRSVCQHATKEGAPLEEAARKKTERRRASGLRVRENGPSLGTGGLIEPVRILTDIWSVTHAYLVGCSDVED